MIWTPFNTEGGVQRAPGTICSRSHSCFRAMLGFESDLWKACAWESFCTIGTSQENGHFIGTTVKADKTNFPCLLKLIFQLCVLLVVCLWLSLPTYPLASFLIIAWIRTSSSCVSHIVNLSDLTRLEAAVDDVSQVHTILYLGMFACFPLYTDPSYYHFSLSLFCKMY